MRTLDLLKVKGKKDIFEDLENCIPLQLTKEMNDFFPPILLKHTCMHASLENTGFVFQRWPYSEKQCLPFVNCFVADKLHEAPTILSEEIISFHRFQRVIMIKAKW